MFSFPSEESLSQLFLTFSLFGESFFFFLARVVRKVTLTERQTCFVNVNLLLSGLGAWAGLA